jgi:hypothetical protein
VIDASERQLEKQDGPMTVTEAGRRIDLRPLEENASLASWENCEPDSNVIDSSEPQSEKQDGPMTVTEAGR